MNGLQLFRELKYKLLRKGIAPSYVDRLIQELSEHQEDLKSGEFAEHQDTHLAEIMAAQRLGSVDELAENICDRMRQRTFIGRHPWVSYLFLPILTFAVGLALIGLALSGAEWLRAELTGAGFEDDAPDWAYPVLLCVTYLLKYGLTAIIAYFLCRIAMRTFCGIRWATIGVLSMVIFSLFIWMHVLPPDESFPKSVQIQLGVGLPVDLIDHTLTFSGIACYLKEQLLFAQGLWHYVPFFILGGYYLQIRRRTNRSNLACD